MHHEFVYYDAGREQGRCYRLFCCPHYGKITSERVLYSKMVGEDFSLWKPRTWLTFITRCWNHDVQSLDYDFVCVRSLAVTVTSLFLFPRLLLTHSLTHSLLLLFWLFPLSLDSLSTRCKHTTRYDVSVDQRFHEFCTDTGTVIIHIKGNADASTMKVPPRTTRCYLSCAAFSYSTTYSRLIVCHPPTPLLTYLLVCRQPRRTSARAS